ncbi:hypothetical protein C8Q78DRAFT_180017 [Trametes maxima]|nr:hypothetical protein C8Q78DRAFT_180017 [Trametes maxima]
MHRGTACVPHAARSQRSYVRVCTVSYSTKLIRIERPRGVLVPGVGRLCTYVDQISFTILCKRGLSAMHGTYAQGNLCWFPCSLPGSKRHTGRFCERLLFAPLIKHSKPFIRSLSAVPLACRSFTSHLHGPGVLTVLPRTLHHNAYLHVCLGLHEICCPGRRHRRTVHCSDLKTTAVASETPTVPIRPAAKSSPHLDEALQFNAVSENLGPVHDQNGW